ncbi:MAG: hypothetical protein KBD36_06395 [Alphaproteobacteria bacterium]|nr:hypothetical protein [Alphaproteobacteria bacterium]
MTKFAHYRDTSWEKGSPSGSSQVVVIRRELVNLTGDHFSAVVLNQLLYWTQRIKDFDLLLEEERNFHPECNVSPRHGWIYKTGYDLIEETMLGISHPTMRKYLKLLVDQGWIDERTPSVNKWNKTTQYRVNLRKLQKDLVERGDTLPEAYLSVFDSSSQEEINSQATPNTLLSDEESSTAKNLHSNASLSESTFISSLSSEESSSVRNSHSDEKFGDLQSNAENLHSDARILQSSASSLHSNARNLHSNVKNLHSYTYTENKTENKNREHTQRTRAREGGKFFIQEKNSNPENPECVLEKMLDLWKRCIGQDVILTRERKCQLHSILSLYFQRNMQQWEQFCERIKGSPFLMGEGGRRWHVTLDWVLNEANLCKVLEGNFDNPESLELKEPESTKVNRDQERSDILSSIQDSTWQDWCAQLSCQHQQKSPVSLFILKEIANARFVEFDGRLVWVESEDPKILSRINDLRLQLLPIVQRSFPETRNIRTQLREDNSLTFPALKNDSIILTHSTHQGENYAQ